MGGRAKQFTPALDPRRHVSGLRPTKHGRFETAETEVQRVALHPGQRERHSSRVSVSRQAIDHRPSWISKTEELGDFVERLSSRVVACLPEQAVMEILIDFEQVSVPAAYDQRHGRQFHWGRAAGFQDHGMNVALDMIHAYQPDALREA